MPLPYKAGAVDDSATKPAACKALPERRCRRNRFVRFFRQPVRIAGAAPGPAANLFSFLPFSAKYDIISLVNIAQAFPKYRYKELATCWNSRSCRIILTSCAKSLSRRPAARSRSPLPICAATLRELLGALPEQVDAAVSGNILKNVKSVVVPNTGGRKGIAPAIAVGLVAGDAARDLQVISAVTEKQLAELDAYLQRVEISVSCSHSPCQLDIDLRGSCGSHTARVRITNHHTNIVCLERDGEVLRELPVVDSAEEHRAGQEPAERGGPSCALRPRCRSRTCCPCWSRRSAATPPLPRRASAAHGARRSGAFYWRITGMISSSGPRPMRPRARTPA